MATSRFALRKGGEIMINEYTGYVLLLGAVAVLRIIVTARRLQQLWLLIEKALMQATYNILYGRKNKKPKRVSSTS